MVYHRERYANHIFYQDLMVLEPIAEACADHNSYGFRKVRSTADVIEQGFKFLSKSDAPERILEGDIKGCFGAPG
jgi:RNA-directed DNA polymerase